MGCRVDSNLVGGQKALNLEKAYRIFKCVRQHWTHVAIFLVFVHSKY